MEKITSVIVPCWLIDKYLLSLTRLCVEAVKKASNVELILIDNGSIMGSEYLKENADIYIKNETNLGFTKAINQGFKAATGKYIVVGNNDYIIRPGWEKELQGVVNNVDICGTAAPHVNGDEHPEDSSIWVEFLPGSWFMMSRKTFDLIGLYDERFKNIFSDTDYVFRMKEHNLFPLATSHTVADHFKSATISKAYDGKKEYAKTRKIFVEKWKHLEDFKGIDHISR